MRFDSFCFLSLSDTNTKSLLLTDYYPLPMVQMLYLSLCHTHLYRNIGRRRWWWQQSNNNSNHTHQYTLFVPYNIIYEGTRFVTFKRTCNTIPFKIRSYGFNGIRTSPYIIRNDFLNTKAHVTLTTTPDSIRFVCVCVFYSILSCSFSHIHG